MANLFVHQCTVNSHLVSNEGRVIIRTLPYNARRSSVPLSCLSLKVFSHVTLYQTSWFKLAQNPNRQVKKRYQHLTSICRRVHVEKCIQLPNLETDVNLADILRKAFLVSKSISMIVYFLVNQYRITEWGCRRLMETFIERNVFKLVGLDNTSIKNSIQQSPFQFKQQMRGSKLKPNSCQAYQNYFDHQLSTKTIRTQEIKLTLQTMHPSWSEFSKRKHNNCYDTMTKLDL